MLAEVAWRSLMTSMLIASIFRTFGTPTTGPASAPIVDKPLFSAIHTADLADLRRLYAGFLAGRCYP